MGRRLSLLDEALGIDDQAGVSSLSNGRVVLIEDCVETSGMFVIYHIIKLSLSSHSSGVVVFLGLSHPFSHYDRILRKLGCNLAVHRDNKRFFFFDLLMLETSDGGDRNSKRRLIDLYEKMQRVMEDISSRKESKRNVTIVIDDFSLIEVAAHGSLNYCLDFLHYCHTLTSDFGCSLVILNHQDVYSGEETPSLVLQMEYQAVVLIKAEPLATGLATDVHGQLTVMNRGIHVGQKSSGNNIYNVHFRLRENGVDCFYPGTMS